MYMSPPKHCMVRKPSGQRKTFKSQALKPRQAFIWSMATIKRAAAEVNRDLDLIDKERANAIVQAGQEVIDGKWNDQSVVDPVPAGGGPKSQRWTP